jgi:hypothetical protein
MAQPIAPVGYHDDKPVVFISLLIAPLHAHRLEHPMKGEPEVVHPVRCCADQPGPLLASMGAPKVALKILRQPS